MNFTKILVVVLLFVSCKSQEKTDETNLEEGPKTFLQYEGKKNMPNIVLVSGDEEYRSEEALPQLAKILTNQHGFNTTVLFAQDTAQLGKVDPNFGRNIPGLEHLDDADLMIIFTRFRALPDSQMKHIDNFLLAGKPVIGLRTSTHAFNFKKEDESNYKRYGNYHGEDDQWKNGFGKFILGENWVSHHGSHGNQSTRGIFAEGAEENPILNGIASGEIWGPTDVYEVRLPMSGDSKPLILGQVTNREGEKDEADVLLGMRSTDKTLPDDIEKKGKKMNQNNPMMPVAWTKTYQLEGGQKGKVFTTTMGAATDLLNEQMRRIIVNAVFWGVGETVPAKASVNLEGDYKPSRFAFHKDEHWDTLNLIIGENVK
ncbi:ThuA domain-containing protein [Portibacter lacus]|uniref:ThuA-like domain-containing protein n=1 Tax=Portibacter lacus TaxID=1099794 RepID=A0AA37SPG4_9BACT|nr:ThuA domain-containing protein [Portibacter lacus]GLR18503.1 hypothetical protein GCM10007940_31190 [Portibacter lacus]